MIHSTVSAPKGEKTKYRLAESMKECMKTTPVEEITVRQICEICGVTVSYTHLTLPTNSRV